MSDEEHEIRICKFCKKEFTSKFNQKYCSKLCREKSKYLRHKKKYSEYMRKWYKRNREKTLQRVKKYNEAHKEEIKQRYTPKKRREWSRKSNRKNKIIVMEYYSGSSPPKCACCGESHIEFLEIDHIGGGGCEHRRKLGLVGGTVFYRWLIKNNFPKGFRVLCANCNRAYGSYKYCPHNKKETLISDGDEEQILLANLCKNFIDDGCQIWCLDGDLDCCVLCCKRRECAKEGKICPIAEVILKMKEFKGKRYSWE